LKQHDGQSGEGQEVVVNEQVSGVAADGRGPWQHLTWTNKVHDESMM
jgi:hypothetical protein